MTDEEKQIAQDKLLKEFEDMLGSDDDEDFGSFLPQFYPNDLDLEFPEESDLELEEPPPIPKEIACKHKNKKKVVISVNLKYWYCKDCKGDLGDAG